MRDDLFSLEQVLHHRLAIDRMKQRAAHFDIAEPRIVAAQVEPTPGSGTDVNLPLSRLLPLLPQDHGTVKRNRAAHAKIDFAGEHRGKIGVGIFDGFVGHAVDLRPAQGKIFERFEFHPGPGVPLDHPIRPGANEVLVPVRQIGERLHIACTEGLLEQMTRKCAHVSVLDGIGFVVEIVPVDNDGPIIGSFNLRDQVRHQPVGHGKFRMLGDLPTEFEIFRGVWFAIVPRETGAQFINRNHGLFLRVDLPGALLHRGKLFGEHGDTLQSYRILSHKTRIDHRHMFGLAPIVISEAGNLAFSVDDDPFSRRLSGKKQRIRPRGNSRRSHRYTR